MSLAYLFDPNIQFQDKSGNNNVSGFVRVYFNGTDDYAPTYKDFIGTFNKRDIKLDNNGRCVVIVDEDYTYRIEVYNREGSCLWTQYPVRPTNVNISYGEYNTYNMSADVYGTTDEIDVTNEENPTTGFKKFFISLSNTVKNTISTLVDNVSTLFTNLSGEITRAQSAESALNTAIGNEVTRATGRENELGSAIATEVTRATAAEKSAKTEVKAGDNIYVTKTTGADGHDIYTIDGVDSVPNVQITSPNSTISVSSSEDPQTNTKTFEIDVANGGNSCGWFNSSNIDTVGNEESINVDRFRISEGQTVIGNGLEFVPIEGDVESGVQFGNVYAKAGIYFVCARLNLLWRGNPVNKICNVAGRQFDFSYNHEEKVVTTKLVRFNSRTKMSVNISLESDIPAGLRIWVDRFQIFAINAGTLEIQGIEAVEHDDTLTGDGTSENPLSVVVDNVLDADSVNPVQNKVLYGIIGNVETLLEDL